MTTSNDERVTTIRRRLLLLLLVPALIILVAGTFSDYFSSRLPIQEAYDQALTDAALAIAAHIRVGANGHATLALPAEAVAILKADSFDSIYFKVSAADRSFIAGDINLPQIFDAKANPARGEAQYQGSLIRFITYRAQSDAGFVNITVGETMRKRQLTRARTLSRALAVDIAQLTLILAILWYGVRIALEPLRQIREQIERRSARSLEPLGLQSVPLEIRSIVEVLNRLFFTVRESSAAQRRFLESAAHQLRTPLSGIQAQLELMVADETDAGKREHVALILGGARRLSHTTQQLLTLARSDESANLTWEVNSVDLCAVVEQIVAARLTTADMASVDLGARMEPAQVDGVTWLLSEALGNLTDNALAHTQAGGSVTVCCGTVDSIPYLEVNDTGIGIPPAEREFVLERFARGSNARGTGSGLGLAIVNEVAHQHGARLDIRSGPDGSGTTVRLLFDGIGDLRLKPSANPAGAAVG